MKEREQKPTNQPEIDEQIRHRAEAIALFMGGDYNMTVGVGPWGSGWHWDFVNNHVNMDAKDLATEPEDVVRGVAAHEGNHRKVSRTDSVKHMWQEPGFSFGFNAVEDPRANEGGMKFMPGTRKWIKAYIERDLGPGGGLDYQGMEKAAKDKMGYVPDFMKWGAEMIRDWYERELTGRPDTAEARKRFLSQIPDKNVRETVEKTLGSFEKYYKTLPDSGDEMDVSWKAREAAQNFTDNIWPIYQGLVEKSVKDQSMADMIGDMMQQGGQGDGRQMEIPFSSLPKDIQDEIKKKVEEAAKEAQSGSGQGQSQSEQEKQGQGPSKIKVPWDKLSEKAKKEAEKAFGNLPQGKKDKYKEQAEEEIKDAEDDANEKLRGKMNDPGSFETHKEKKQRKQGEKERAQENAEAQQQIEDSVEEVKKLLEEIPEDPYQYYLNLPEVDAVRRKMEQELKLIFEPTENPDTRYSSTGLRASMKKAVQMEADPRKINIFESKGKPMERVFRFIFLLDLSGSMSGEKIIETFKSLIPIIENLNKFGIEFAVLGYSDNIRGNVKVYKPFEVKKLTREARNKLGELLNDGGGGTPSLAATKVAYKKLLERMAQVSCNRNYFIPLTDGAPTDSSPDELLEYNNKIRRNRNIVMAGFGIGPDSHYVNVSYPSLPREVKTAVARKLGKSPDRIGNSYRSASEFGEIFAIIAGYMVKRPELFFS